MLAEAALLILTGLFCLFLYGRWRHSHWQRLGVSSPPAKTFLGHLLHTFSSVKPVWIWRDELHHQNKRDGVTGLYNFLTPQLLVSDPHLLKRILVKDFDSFGDRRHLSVGGPEDRLLTDMLSNATGETWRRIRTLVTPAFTSGRLKTMYPLVLQKAKVLAQVAKALALKGHPVETKKLVGRYTMDVTASCAFGLEANTLLDEEDEFGKRAAQLFNPSKKRILELMFFYIAPRLCRAIGFKATSPQMRYYGDVVSKVLKHREETGTRRGDFIDLMIDARKAHDDETDEGAAGGAGKKFALENITVVAQSVIFLLAGYGNMANTLAFCLYHLARDEALQERAREEITDLREKHGPELSYEAIMEAKFLEACISETLRLYPSESAIDRQCLRDYKLGETRILIPKGMIVEVPVWSLQHDPDYWPEPEEFRPDRFLSEKSNVNPYTYLPFGLGPRNCIGLRFSMMVMKTALAFFLQDVRMVVAPSQSHPIEMACSPFVLRSKEDIKLLFEPVHSTKG